jgi:hypothetical protein
MSWVPRCGWRLAYQSFIASHAPLGHLNLTRFILSFRFLCALSVRFVQLSHLHDDHPICFMAEVGTNRIPTVRLRLGWVGVGGCREVLIY